MRTLLLTAILVFASCQTTNKGSQLLQSPEYQSYVKECLANPELRKLLFLTSNKKTCEEAIVTLSKVQNDQDLSDTTRTLIREQAGKM